MASYLEEQQQALAYLRGEMNDEEQRAFEDALTRSDEQRAELERSRELLDLLAAASEESIVKRVNRIIVQAIGRAASDIHLVPEKDETVVSLRVDGYLQEMERFPREFHRPVVNRWKTMAQANLTQWQVPQEGLIPVRHHEKDYNLRVSFLPQLYGERVTAHLMDKSAVFLGLQRLELSPSHRESLKRLAERGSGLIVTAGSRAAARRPCSTRCSCISRRGIGSRNARATL